MKTIFGVFSDFLYARETVALLLEHGFDKKELNAIVQQPVAKNYFDVRRNQAKIETCTSSYDLLDRMLTGKGSVNSADCGPLIASGIIATTMLKTVDTELDRKIENALRDFDVRGEVAERYKTRLAEGQLLLFIRVPDEKAMDAVIVMESRGGEPVSAVP